MDMVSPYKFRAAFIAIFSLVWSFCSQISPVVVPENQVDVFVNDLIDRKLIPNALGSIRQYSSAKCIDCFVQYLLAQKGEFWVKYGFKKLDISWISRLPQQVQDGIKFKYWLSAKARLNPTDFQPIEGLHVDDLKHLAQAGLIPPCASAQSYQDIARFWVSHYSKPAFFTKWSLCSKDYKVLADWLRVLPVELQRAVKCYFRCNMLANSKYDVWLGNDTTIEVPVSYLVEKKLIPLPTSVDTLEALIELEERSTEELAQRYADFLHSIDHDEARTRAIASKLSRTFKRDVIQKFCEIPENKTPAKKIFDVVLQSLGGILSNEARINACAQDVIDHENKLILSDYDITEIESNGFNALVQAIAQKNSEAAIRVLDLSRNKIKTLSKKSFKGLNEVRVIDLSDNQLESLDPQVFQHTPLLEKIILRGNKLTSLPKRLFAKLHHLRVLDLSDNQLLPDELPFLGDLNLEELYLKNNKLTRFSNVFAWSADSEERLKPEDIAIAKRLKILDLSNNQLSFNGVVSNEFSIALSLLKALEYLDLSGNSIKFLHDVIACELLELKHLLIDNNPQLKFCSAHENRVVVLPKLVSLQAKKCGITTLHDWKCSSFPNLRVLMLQHNDIADLNGVFSTLTKLKDLYLQGNKISKVERKDFASLQELENLHLEGNMIRDFPEHLFHGLNLKEVWLFANNPQFTFENKNNVLKAQETVINESAFSGMEKLEYLDLSYNMIAKVPNTFVKGDYNLKWLSLAYNKIAEIPSLMLSGLDGLKTLDLACNKVRNVAVNALYGPLAHLDIYFEGNAAFGFHKFASDLELSKKIFARYLSIIPGNSYFFGNGASIHTRLIDQFPLASRGIKMSIQTLFLMASLTYYAPVAYVLIAHWLTKTSCRWVMNYIQNPKIEVFKRDMIPHDLETQLQVYKKPGSIEDYFARYRETLRERYTDRKVAKVTQTLL